MAMQWTWRTLTGVPVADVVDFVRENAREGQAVHVGTDSLQLARHTRFVTVVAILTPGRGGRAIWRREVRPRIASLRERLLREVWLSVELGLSLSPVVPGRAQRPHRREPGGDAPQQPLRAGAGGPGREPGVPGRHQARELGGEPRRGPDGPRRGPAPRDEADGSRAGGARTPPGGR